MPNLNARPFLPERFESIFRQDFADWELLVYDSHSDDGSWEYIREVARTDHRVRVWQGPREGIYPAWNACIGRAAGDLVYVATSDDTMADDCLGKLVAALTAEPGCGLAHCPVRFIDRDGNRVDDWWSPHAPFRQSTPDLADVPHVRLAPLDGLLHLTGQSVYFSVTQLLIRRATLDRVGPFDATWGSFGDFHWNMRATLVSDTAHVPDTWGGWRMHPDQATARADTGSEAYWGRIYDLTRDAIRQSADGLPPTMVAALVGRWRDYHRQHERLNARLAASPSRWGRLWTIGVEAARGSTPARDLLRWKARGGRGGLQLPGLIRDWATVRCGRPLIRPAAPGRPA